MSVSTTDNYRKSSARLRQLCDVSVAVCAMTRLEIIGIGAPGLRIEES